MKKSKKQLLSAIAFAVLASTAMTPTAHAEVSASLGISNFYFWRGIDLSDDGEGSSAPAISGDITFSSGGFYTGIWASSGDETLGQEYDLYVGWGGSFGDFSVDLSYWTYLYPSADPEPIGAGDAADFIVALGYGPVALTIYENLEDDGAGARYTSLDYTSGKFNFLVGHNDDGTDASQHLQVAYSYNDNLKFTASKYLDDDTFNDEVLFNIAYSFDIK